MALDYSREVQLAMPASASPFYLAATDDKIYALSSSDGNSSNINRIYSFNKDGSINASETISVTPLNYQGMTMRANDLISLIYQNTAANPVQSRILTWNVSGTGPSQVNLTYFSGRFRVTLPIDFDISGLYYDSLSTRFDWLSAADRPGIGGYRLQHRPTGGNPVSLVNLIAENRNPYALAGNRTHRWVSDFQTRKVYAYDASYNYIEEQPMMDVPSAGSIPLAESAGQLLTVFRVEGSLPTRYNLQYYGPEPVEPAVIPSAIAARQVQMLDSKFFERFDIVTPGNTISVKATDFEAIRQSSISYIDVPGAQTLQQRLNTVEITPKITIPGVSIGDNIFLHGGPAGVKPTAIPGDAYEIVGIEQVANNYRQTFICTL